MLYSYLLTRSEFKIETMPESATRDKKYAYSLYFDLILFILKLSGYNVGSNNSYAHNYSALNESKLAKSLISNNDIRENIIKGNNHIDLYDGVLQEIYNIIISSSAYKDYKKIKSPEIQDDVKFWNVILQSVIVKNNSFVEAARNNEDFTMKGFEMGVEMVVDTLTNYSDTRTSLSDAHKSLIKSLDKSYELYFSIFKLMIELTELQYQRLDAAKSKYLPSVEDLNPNTRFVDNQLIKSVESNPDFLEYISKNPISWIDEPLFLKSMLDKILGSDIYNDYMSAPGTSYITDCEFWRNVLKNIIFNDDEFIEMLEAKSALWNDDLHVIGTFVIKSIKHFANTFGENTHLIPQFKDEEDAEFGKTLFAETIKNFDLYRSYIDKFISQQWDSDRLAFMDIVIMTTAIAEMIKFPLIPIPVTLNEFIEIANGYSTPKSGQFINGILFSVINYLKDEGVLNK